MLARDDKKKSKEGRRRFEYKPRSADDVKARAARSGGRWDSPYKQEFGVWRARVGENQIRILQPTWDDHDHYAYQIYVHKRIGPDNSTYLCLSKMQNKPCPICAAAKEAQEAGEEDEAKALRWGEINLCWILDRDGEDPTQPVLFPMSFTQDKEILNQSMPKGKVLLIDHPDQGYDVIVRRTGQGLNTKYSFTIDRESTPISDDSKEYEEIQEFIHDNPLPSVLKYYDADYLEKVISGTEPEKDKDLDDDENERPRRGRRDEDDDADDTRSRSRRRRDEDEDDAQDRPSSRRSRRDRDEDDNKEEDNGEETQDEDKEKEDSQDYQDNEGESEGETQDRDAEEDDESDRRSASGRRSSRERERSSRREQPSHRPVRRGRR